MIEVRGNMEQKLKRSWTEINLSALRKNYTIYQSLQPAGRKIMAVVKADAYGHGDVETAKALSELGCTDFAVSNSEEALKLRHAGIKGQILILGYTPVDQAQALFENEITQALVSEEYAEALAKSGFAVKAQFALDTGMRRIGLNADDPENCERAIRKYAALLTLTGVFTHLCVADTETPEAIDFTKKQIQLYEAVVKRIGDLQLPYCHCMNSAGGLWHDSEFSCFSRLGIVLYGLKPDFANTLPEGIEPVLEWKSVVSMVKEISKGDTVGYGRAYRANQTMRIATVTTGYADGYHRLLSNRGYVLIHGKKAPIVGRVCMDQFMVDVSEIENVSLGTEVVLIGRSGSEVLTADDMAQMVGTIGYEIVCDISKRVKRYFIDSSWQTA